MLTLSQWFIYTKKYMALPCKYKKVFRCFHITNNDPNNKCASIKTENIGPNQEIIPIHLLTPKTISLFKATGIPVQLPGEGGSQRVFQWPS